MSATRPRSLPTGRHRWRSLLGVAALALVADRGLPAEGPVVRFHHVHFAVGDPSAAMRDVAARIAGIRTIVQGLGVGVRAGDEFLLFDRAYDADPEAPSTRPFAEAYASAIVWLARAGIAAEPADPRQLRVSPALPDVPFQHIGFVAADLGAAVERIERTASAPLRRRDDAVLFDAGGGLLVEIVRDTTRPDAFWCPMHPDVRSADPGTCQLCGMDLVRIPPPKLGEYRLDVAPERARGGRGLSGLRLTVREPDSNEPVSRFETVHEKPFHLFVIGRDLEFFAHVHPDQMDDGAFRLEQPIPPGEYMLIADFLPVGGTSQMVQKAIISPPLRDPLRSGDVRSRREAAGADRPATALAGGLAVTLEGDEALAGKELVMTFTVRDAASGEPVTDLEPYLGAPAHMLIVRSDLTEAIHAHPEEQSTAGPTVSFHPLIPSIGDYKLWIQFQRGGRVITVPFGLRAER